MQVAARRTCKASVVAGLLSLNLTSYRPTTNSLFMSTSPQRLPWLHFAFLSYLNGLYHCIPRARIPLKFSSPRLADLFERCFRGRWRRASERPSVSGTRSGWRIWSARPSYTEPERRLWKEREGRKGYIFTRAAFPKFKWKRWLLQFQFRPLDVEKGGGKGEA